MILTTARTNMMMTTILYGIFQKGILMVTWSRLDFVSIRDIMKPPILNLKIA